MVLKIIPRMNLPFGQSPWQKFPGNHPQGDILKSHMEQSMQDLFLISIRNLDDEFIWIFDSTEEIEQLCEGMLYYREAKEEYEICNEILKIKPVFLEKWETFERSNKSQGDNQIKAWLKSTL